MQEVECVIVVVIAIGVVSSPVCVYKDYYQNIRIKGF